jgi:hypothetical protein
MITIRKGKKNTPHKAESSSKSREKNKTNNFILNIKVPI